MNAPFRRNSDGEVVLTHLDDLQAEIEAGSRTADTIMTRAERMREALLARHLEQAAIAGALVRQIGDLQKSIAQQRERLAELRRAIRHRRASR